VIWTTNKPTERIQAAIRVWKLWRRLSARQEKPLDTVALAGRRVQAQKKALWAEVRLITESLLVILDRRPRDSRRRRFLRLALSMLKSWSVFKATGTLALLSRVMSIGKLNVTARRWAPGPLRRFWENFRRNGPRPSLNGRLLLGPLSLVGRSSASRFISPSFLENALAQGSRTSRRPKLLSSLKTARMAQISRRDVVCVFGLAGSGKTRWARWYVRQQRRAIILEAGFAGENEYPGVKVPDFWSFHEYMNKNKDGVFRVRYAATPAEFPLVCEWAAVAGSLSLVVEEADRYLQQGCIPAEFLELTFRGRHFGDSDGVSIVVISLDPMKMPIDIRRQATRMVIFNTVEPGDVEWLSKVIGKDWAEKCKALPAGRGLEWVKGGDGCREFTLEEIGA
jgi:hypothetical protein